MTPPAEPKPNSFFSDFRKPVVWVPLVLTTLLAIYFWWDGKVRPTISYQVSTVKIYDRDASADTIRVLGKDGKLIGDSVFAAEVVIWNSGNATIEPDWVRRPLEVSTGEETHLIDAQIVAQTHDGASSFALTPVGQNRSRLSWHSFDPGEGCKIRIIYSSSAGASFTLSGLIYEVPAFREVAAPRAPEPSSSPDIGKIVLGLSFIAASFLVPVMNALVVGLLGRIPVKHKTLKSAIGLGLWLLVTCALVAFGFFVAHLYNYFVYGLAAPRL